jgi:hypothetical protein
MIVRSLLVESEEGANRCHAGFWMQGRRRRCLPDGLVAGLLDQEYPQSADETKGRKVRGRHV